MRAGVQADAPLCLDREVVGQPRIALVVFSAGYPPYIYIYISYDEVAVQCPVGGGSCSSPALSSILSICSESKSSMSVKLSTVAIKWVVGGERISSSSASHSSRTQFSQGPPDKERDLNEFSTSPKGE